jgi:hypothetical protein
MKNREEVEAANHWKIASASWRRQENQLKRETQSESFKSRRIQNNLEIDA